MDANVEILPLGVKNEDPQKYRCQCAGHCCRKNSLWCRTRYDSRVFCKVCWARIKKIEAIWDRVEDEENAPKAYLHAFGTHFGVKPPLQEWQKTLYYWSTTERDNKITPHYSYRDKEFNARVDGEYVPTCGIEVRKVNIGCVDKNGNHHHFPLEAAIFSPAADVAEKRAEARRNMANTEVILAALDEGGDDARPYTISKVYLKCTNPSIVDDVVSGAPIVTADEILWGDKDTAPGRVWKALVGGEEMYVYSCASCSLHHVSGRHSSALEHLANHRESMIKEHEFTIRHIKALARDAHKAYLQEVSNSIVVEKLCCKYSECDVLAAWYYIPPGGEEVAVCEKCLHEKEGVDPRYTRAESEALGEGGDDARPPTTSKAQTRCENPSIMDDVKSGAPVCTGGAFLWGNKDTAPGRVWKLSVNGTVKFGYSCACGSISGVTRHYASALAHLATHRESVIEYLKGAEAEAVAKDEHISEGKQEADARV